MAFAVIKVHPRKSAGGRSTDTADFPPEQAAYAMRDIAFLQRQADLRGDAVGRFARALLQGPLPWTRMRRVFALLGLCKRYGDARVETACQEACAVEMHDVRRLERMIKLARPHHPEAMPGSAKIVPIARFLRPQTQYAIVLTQNKQGSNNQGDAT